MKIQVLLLAVLLAAAPYLVPAFSAAEQMPARPLLWSEQGAGRLWLYGTIHLPLAAEQALPPAARRAIEAADVVLTEIPLDPVTRMKAYEASLLPEGQSLADVLPAALVARLEAEMEARGLSFAAFSRLRPWAMAGQLALLDQDFAAGALPVDLQIWALAGRRGKTAAGLETLGEQIAAFEALGPGGQAWLLEQALDELERARTEGSRASEPIVAAWRSGKLEALEQVLEEQAPAGEARARAFREELIDKRNHRMAERILARLRAEPDRRIFVAVGALHLAGREGLLARLGRRGLQLVQAPAPVHTTVSEEAIR
ncbi:MAG: TraB/GumN family protein [Acidobacteriota bacterium]|nr:TraB/GumN family protein [Acidobacteriota bacterium]